MNKVFKVIWSEARNAYVVVSEMAKNHGTKSCSTKKLLAMLIATGVMTCASVAPAMAKNLTDTQTQPKMIGYQQKWNTDVAKGLLETSINGYQYQGNSLQLNMLQFEKYTTQKGENALHITLGAYVDGVNKNASINFVDTNTKNQTLTTTINSVNAGDYFFDAERGVGFDGEAYVTQSGLNANNKVITNVAAGEADTDAVNVSQLKKVSDTANAGWNLSPNGVATEATNVKPGDYVDFSGDKNISVSHDGNKVQVELNKNIDVNSIQTNALNAKYNLSVGTMAENGIMPFLVNSTGAFYAANNNFSVDKDGKVIATAGEIGNVVLKNGVYTGNSALRDGELYVGDASGNYSQITTTGAKLGQVTIAADGKISGVAAGEVSKTSTDAINGGQLHQAKADINNRIDGVENQVVSNTNRINQLGSRVNKVGAGAAALAALHPMDFDPDDKLTFSAGYGNYGGENAAAIGAYYRPDEKVMFSVAGTVGNGENMVNAGVSFALDRTNHVSNSRTALAREVIDLRGQLAVMGAKMAKMEKAFGMLDETKTKLFPDVPANHWAYEYIAKLAGNGYIEGYPDGNFGGDRLMTRYEFAAMLYRAIEKGAALEEKIIKEFEPELGRIRVDRISGEDGDRDKIERVRVNDTKGERDHYGNKLAK